LGGVAGADNGNPRSFWRGKCAADEEARRGIVDFAEKGRVERVKNGGHGSTKTVKQGELLFGLVYCYLQ